jgi:hypothetical protein
MFASTARVAQERNLLNNMRLEDEGRKELDSEFILPVTKRFVVCLLCIFLVSSENVKTVTCTLHNISLFFYAAPGRKTAPSPPLHRPITKLEKKQNYKKDMHI